MASQTWSLGPRARYLRVAILAVVVFLAAGLRFYKLGSWSLWVDEGFSIRDIQSIGSTRPITSTFHFLYYVLSKPILLGLGVNEFSARLLPSIAGIVSVPLIYLGARRIFNPWVGLLSATFLCLSPWHIYWSQNARFYTLLMLLYSLALFLAFLALDTSDVRYSILSVLVSALALITHPTAAIIVAVVFMDVVLLRLLRGKARESSRTKSALPFLALPILAAVYELLRVDTQQSSAVESMTPFLSGSINLHGFRLLAGAVFLIGIPLACLAFGGGLQLMQRKEHRGLFLLISIVIPIPILFAPVSQTRYVFLSLPSWILLGSFAVWELQKIVPRTGTLLALGVLLTTLVHPIAEDLFYYRYQYGYRWDWKGAFELVKEARQEEDLVATTWQELGEYYLGSDVLQVSELDPEKVTSLDRRIWVVDDGWANPELDSWLHDHAELIEKFAVYIPGKILQIDVFLYDPNPVARGD